ncbi:RIP metalloprotease RseP [Hwanghaeella sp.]|uniref:RIP metalloprotease RseP n=1 Tax=Hwanghaeella sp. TaxID=2605943 RepID=UPI003CCC0CD9
MDELIGALGHWNFIPVLCVLVFVHELGHYAVARWCGVRVETFSIGFGKELFGWTDSHGTRWRVSMLPLGGYVKMFGEHSMPSEIEGGSREMTAAEQEVSFSHKSLGRRAAVVAAGPAANFIFAILVLAALFMFVGQPKPQDFATAGIGGVVEGSAAAEAGLIAGDRILSIDGAPIETFGDLQTAVVGSGGQALRFEIERDGAVSFLTASPREVTVSGEDGAEVTSYRLGVHGPAPTYVKSGVSEALGKATGETWRIITVTLASVGEMITGDRGTEELGGPVRIVQLSNDFAQMGALWLVHFAVLLSVNLGLINLFPVPMLDGGHLLFYAIEGIRGKALDERTQEYGLRIGLALIVGLMVFVTVNDFIHLPL